MPGLFDGTPLERPVTCEHCALPMADCTCPRDEKGAFCPPSHQKPRVRREKRRGKFVTVIADLDPTATDLAAMAKTLRTTLATGGSVTKNEGGPTIELQGDHCEKIVEYLKSLGYQAKKAGG